MDKYYLKKRRFLKQGGVILEKDSNIRSANSDFVGKLEYTYELYLKNYISKEEYDRIKQSLLTDFLNENEKEKPLLIENASLEKREQNAINKSNSIVEYKQKEFSSRQVVDIIVKTCIEMNVINSFGEDVLLDVLLGKESKVISIHSLHILEHYGDLNYLTNYQILDIINYLVDRKILYKVNSSSPKIKVNMNNYALLLDELNLIVIDTITQTEKVEEDKDETVDLKYDKYVLEIILNACEEMNNVTKMGRTTLASILNGGNSKKIDRWGLKELDCYGALDFLTCKEILEMIDYLIAEDKIIKLGHFRPVIKVKKQIPFNEIKKLDSFKLDDSF